MIVLGWLKSFGAFWYDFIVGDDWRVALSVVMALALTYGLSHSTTASLWWVIPAFVAIVLPVSIHRVTRRRP